MCSIIGGLSPFKMNNANPNLTMTGNSRDYIVEWCRAFAFFTRSFAYISILNLNNENMSEEIRTTENNSLRSRKVIEFNYGTCDPNLESRYYDSGSSSNDIKNNCVTELYDGKLCVVCYDEERNCFFVPCGHCATCYVCARRIFHVENKVCPVCRRCIGKIRKLFAP